MAIQIRRGTDAEWESTNANIVVGEPVVALDSERLFLGTGSGTFMEVANVKALAPVYDSTRQWNMGEYCTYHGSLYICIVPTTGEWNASNWSAADINTALNDNKYTAFEAATVSGDVIAINNGAGDVPVKELKVAITATQDLHGQANPYPAGGGKNKLHITATTATQNGVTFTVNSDGTISLSGTASADTNFVLNTTQKLVQGTSYHIAGIPATGTGSNYYLMSTRGLSAGNTTLGFGQAGTATSEALYLFLHVSSGVNTNGVVVKPMICLATEMDYTFAPYSNVCPIVGYTSADVHVNGVNQWDEQTRGGYYNATTGVYTSRSTMLANANPVRVSPSTTYYLKSDTYNIPICYYDENMNFIRQDGATKNVTFTTPANCRYINFSNSWDAGATYNHDISINFPSTDTDYHPYIGKTYSIALNDTRYFGELNVTTGEMVLTHAGVDLGTLTWVKAGSAETGKYRFTSTGISTVVKRPSANSQKANIICSSYGVLAADEVYLTTIGDGVAITSGGGDISLYDSNKISLTTTEFKQAMDGVQLVYELATPTTVQLSPTEVKTLLHDNVIFANCGTVEELTYRVSNIEASAAPVISMRSAPTVTPTLERSVEVLREEREEIEEPIEERREEPVVEEPIEEPTEEEMR